MRHRYRRIDLFGHGDSMWLVDSENGMNGADDIALWEKWV